MGYRSTTHVERKERNHYKRHCGRYCGRYWFVDSQCAFRLNPQRHSTTCLDPFAQTSLYSLPGILLHTAIGTDLRVGNGQSKANGLQQYLKRCILFSLWHFAASRAVMYQVVPMISSWLGYIFRDKTRSTTTKSGVCTRCRDVFLSYIHLLYTNVLAGVPTHQ